MRKERIAVGPWPEANGEVHVIAGEIDQFQDPVAAQEQVVGFEVVVEDAAAVGIGQRVTNAGGNAENLVKFHLAAGIVQSFQPLL